MTAGPDGVRWTGPTQSSEHEALTAPRVVPAFAAAFQIIINSMQPPYGSTRATLVRRDWFQTAAGKRLVSPRASTAQIIRAVLLVMATVTSRAGLRSSRLRTQLAAGASLVLARRTTDVAPTTSNFLR